MTGLRKFLRSSYGFLAIIFALAAVGTVSSAVRIYSESPLSAPMLQSDDPWRMIISLGLTLLVLITPVPLAFFFGMAWWTLRQKRPSARRWAIASSVITLIFSIPTLLFAVYCIWRRFPGTPLMVYALGFGLPTFGIAGLAAFGRKDPALIAQASVPEPVRVQGDGTNKLLDVLAWGLGGASGILGYHWYRHWGSSHGLELASSLTWWLLFFPASFAATTLHELGHTSVGVVLGMKVRMFQVGPFRWAKREGRWHFEFLPAQIISGGVTSLASTDPKQNIQSVIGMIAAGPAASLLTGLVATALMLTAPGSSYEPAWELFALIALFALSSTVVNLVPFRPPSFYSDGAQILQLIRGGPWADLFRLNTQLQSITVTALRIGSLDRDALRRCVEHYTTGYHALHVLYIASSYFLETGEHEEAARATRDIIRVYEGEKLAPLAEFDIGTVYRISTLLRDASAARICWDRAMSKKLKFKGFDYYLALSALLWVEGRHAEAESAWQEAASRAAKLPACGDAEFDRDRLRELRRLLGGTATAESASAQQAATSD